ncbi:MAG: hypothetical protein FJ109_02355 [Deltaproteobacteria bacterium]|nr:hypothetical protein [Deltaproteobacteria bacterium]
MRDPEFNYRFAPMRLRELDAEKGDLLVLPLFEDDCPPSGLAGLVDWRMDGLISRIRVSTLHPDQENPHYRGLVLGPFAATQDEKLLFPPGRFLSFRMVMIYGLGKKQRYDGQRYREVVRNLLQTLSGMNASEVALQLPGWSIAGVPARRACDVLLTELVAMKRKGQPVPRDLCFVEDLESQAEMEERIREILSGR